MAERWSWTVPQFLFFLFFATHIPITLFIDFQAILPRSFYPQALVDVVDWYATEWGDPFFPLHESYPERMGRTPSEMIWYRAVIWCELIFQFPFFFVAVYGFWTGGNWLRGAAIGYGGHVATTVVVICAEFILNPSFNIPFYNLSWILGVYAPYFIFPFWLTLYMIYYPVPFSNKNKNKSNKKKRK